MFRYSIFAAVSSESQIGEDKLSLDIQVEKCKAIADSRGWRDSGLRYIIPGESRTRWIGLEIAERELPQLKALLDEAQGGHYDILVMYDLNRLRELLDPVARTLSFYNVQIFSVNQPVEPLPPETYSPYISDTSSILQGMASIISRIQTNDLRRKYSTAMPKRILSRGLHPNRLPWGFRKPPGRETDPSAVAVQDSDRCAMLVKVKDSYLSGATLASIVDMLNQSRFPPPYGKTWYATTVKRILVNPFYAGLVQFGSKRTVNDPRTGDRKQVLDSSRLVVGQGRHTALWDVATLHAIQEEGKRRGMAYIRHYNRPLTSLLHCSICDSRLWICYLDHHKRPDRRARWMCRQDKSHQPKWSDEKVMAWFTDHLLRDLNEQIAQPPPEIGNDGEGARLADLKAQRKRLEDGYQAGAFDLPSFLQRTAGLDSEIAQLEFSVNENETATSSARERYELLQSLAEYGESLVEYLTEGDALEVNHLLHSVISRVVVKAEGEVEIFYK